MDAIFSEVTYQFIPGYRMARAKAIGQEPEDEVIARLEKWIIEQGLDVKACRHFGFDIPVSEEDQQKGFRGYEYWMSVPESMEASEDVWIEEFDGGHYASLRITEPFVNPCEIIPQGWSHLMEYIRSHKLEMECFTTGCCLEEVFMTPDETFMDIFIKLKEPFLTV